MADILTHTLRFHRSLYRLEAIEAGVAAYAHLAAFEVRAEPEEVVVVCDLGASHPRLRGTLPGAFGNHVLHHTIRHHQAAR